MPHRTLRINTGTKKEKVVERMINHYLFTLLREPCTREEEEEANHVKLLQKELGYTSKP